MAYTIIEIENNQFDVEYYVEDDSMIIESVKINNSNDLYDVLRDSIVSKIEAECWEDFIDNLK